MQETRADNAQAIGLALLLHAVLFGLVFFGLWWTRSTTPPSAGEPVSAELFDPDSLSQAMRRELAQRPEPLAEPPPEPEPEPLPEPLPEEVPPPPQPQAQEQLPVPDTVEQDEARRDAISDLTAEREQEERHRQEQIDLTERERQEEIERQRQTDMQRERDKQLADIRRQREEARKAAELAEQRLKQIADRRARSASEAAAQDAAASPPPPPGIQGVDPSLLGAYKAALIDAINRNWTRPETVPIGQRCTIVIRQLPGGQVMDAKVDPSCPYDELGRRSVEAAVLKAQPLPYAGFESVFNRTLILNFEAQDR